jgi:3-hydroxyisobutyrate dehydrogenase-like beta-hydroxyacid dehydrogenase
MTSSSPAAVRPICDQAIEKGVQVLEASMGGGIAAAREGKLQLFVGGEADAVSRPAYC